MITQDLKALLGRLNPFCTRALEAAAGIAVSRTHYEVTIEHMMLRMAEDPAADIQAILRHFEVDASRFLRAVQQVIEGMRSGNAGKPVFSPPLIEWFEDAWLLASVEHGLDRIRSGALFESLVAQPTRTALWDRTDAMEKIRRDELRKAFFDIVGGSSEDVRRAEAAAPAQREGTALAQYTIDFTGRAQAGEIDPVFGRDREIRQMIDILARRRKNNPIVVGEAGVGKTAVVEGLALRVVQGDVPSVLSGVEILGLDLGLLQAGAGVKGEFENRLKAVISEVKGSPKPIIMFIDEAHTLIGAGGPSGGSDAANLLKPALARGELRTVAATTWSEYKKYFEKDAALARRFQLVKLDEPSDDDTIVMLRGLRDRYEASHGVLISDPAVVAAARLSSRYISGRQLPDKAVDLLDTAAARVKIGLSARPDSLEDIERRIATFQRELEAHRRDEASGTAVDRERIDELERLIAGSRTELEELEKRWQKEKAAAERVLALRRKIAGDGGEAPKAPPAPEAPTAAGAPPRAGAAPPAEAPAAPEAPPAAEAPPEPPLPSDPAELRAELVKALDELAAVQGKDPLIRVDVDPDVVAKVVSDWTGVPVGKMVRDEAQSILSFEERLSGRIKGQSAAIEAVARGIRASKAGLGNPNAPIGVFLFVGPSGVGKTECGLGVADLLFGGERFIVTINMSEFQEKHTVSRLIGSPPGYVGYGEGGVLTEAVRQRPYSVVLLDEVEKADLEVMNIFYQVFDKGMLADGEGRVIDFKNTVIFMTSNLGSDAIIQMCSGATAPGAEQVVAAVRPVLSQHFRPALLARMTIVPFVPIGPEAMKEIVELKLGHLRGRLDQSHRIALEWEPQVVDQIAERCREVETGARNIDHIMQETLLPRISTEILGRMAEGALPDRVKLGIDEKGDFAFIWPES